MVCVRPTLNAGITSLPPRSAVRWTLSGFGVLAVAYFGVKFVLEDVLGRHWG